MTNALKPPRANSTPAARLSRVNYGRTPMLTLYGHPISSYTLKVLIALYENDTPFEHVTIDQSTGD